MCNVIIVIVRDLTRIVSVSPDYYMSISARVSLLTI